MKVYRRNSKYNHWWLFTEGNWWFGSEDDNQKIYHWFMHMPRRAMPDDIYESSELAFLVSTGETIQESFNRARSV